MRRSGEERARRFAKRQVGLVVHLITERLEALADLTLEPLAILAAGTLADLCVECARPDRVERVAHQVGDQLAEALLVSERVLRIVAARLVDRDLTTLRRYYRENGHVRLEPDNPTAASLIVKPDGVEVQGNVVVVIRQVE